MYVEKRTRRASVKVTTRRATATSDVGGVHETPKNGVLIPLSREAISEGFTMHIVGPSPASTTQKRPPAVPRSESRRRGALVVREIQNGAGSCSSSQMAAIRRARS